MPEDSQSPQPSRPGRIKTQLACDVCRRRKSRCDGRRPACTHCVEMGVDCHYRTVTAHIESDAAFLSRLTAIEGRLETLEERLCGPEEPQLVDSHVQARSSTSVSSFYKIPEFHHGGGHKVLQYWSRLRVHLTIPDVDVLQFLKHAEDQEERFTENISPDIAQAVVPLLLASNCLSCWNEIISHLPIGFSVLLESSILFSSEHISSILDSISAFIQSDAAGPRISDLPLEDLLIYTIAFHSLVDGEADISDICFTLALQRLWRVQVEADEVAIPYLLVVAHVFLYIYSRPFHALGILQLADSAISRLRTHRDSRLLETSVLLFSQIFYLLQSDILSEVDGSPSVRIPPSLPSDRSVQSPVVTSDGQLSTYDYFSANIWLRSCLNRILAHMFITGQAYCQPREVSPIISEISLHIETWYRALPLELQFVRDSRSFEMLMPLIPTRIKELSLRYHACISILTRPVLYFVLYQDIENSVTPSPGSVTAADRHLEPWVFALCRDCIESSKIIIMTLAQHLYRFTIDGDPRAPFSSTGPINGNSGLRNKCSLTWCDIQLLVGSYAVLLSVQNASSFSAAFRDVSSIDEILDAAERVLSCVTARSLGYARTLDILMNIRYNFRVSTPGTGASC